MNNTLKPKPHKVKNSKKKSKSKLSTTKLSATKLSATKLSKTHTISGLPTAAWMSNVIAAATGLFIFLLGPYLVNSLNAPATSALVNVVPNGLIMALFITESEFHEFFSDLLFAPMFNVILTWIAYPLYYYGYLTALQTIWFEILIWAGCCVLSYVFTPFYISNADFNDIKKIKKYKINSRNFTYDGLTFSSSVFILEEVKDEI